MAEATVQAVPINADAMKKLGIRLKGVFDVHEKDRHALELQWLKNLRQHKGIYDPEVLALIDADMSLAYPKITRQKVNGTVSRMMEMLFPQTEKNWSCDVSPVPDLAESIIQQVLDALQAEAGTQPSEDGSRQVPAELSDEKIEHAVMETARARAARMTRNMTDQLESTDYVQKVRRVVFSGTLYGAGVLKGPLVKQEKRRKWTRDGATGQYKAVTLMEDVPYFENVPVWDYYPDLSAKTLDQQDFEFQRHIMSRAQVRALADRSDFMRDQVMEWLKDHTAGNFRERHWETDLRSNYGNGQSDRANVTDLSGRKYELVEGWGYVTGGELRACGVDIAEANLHDEYEACVWTIDNIVIKCRLNAYQTKRRPFHVFVFEEDDISLLGSGLPVALRDSQMAVAEAARMTLDNGSLVCGPMLEVIEELLVPGQDSRIHARKIWKREHTPGDQTQAVREIKVDGHLGELRGIMEFFMGMADLEAALPPPAMGDISKGGSEALRTTTGASMLMGAASLPIRDTVRNFDRFTVSAIGSLYDWNMQFGSDEEAKGDYTITARGSTSLVAKEVRAQALAMFRATLTPEEAVYVDDKKMLLEKMRANDVPMEVLDTQENVDKKQADRSAAARKQQELQEQQIIATVRKDLAGAFKDIALGMKSNQTAEVETFTAIMEGLSNVLGDERSGTGATGKAPAKQG